MEMTFLPILFPFLVFLSTPPHPLSPMLTHTIQSHALYFLLGRLSINTPYIPGWGKKAAPYQLGVPNGFWSLLEKLKTCFLPIGCSLLFANNERTKTEIWQTSLAIQVLKTIHTGACSIAQATIDCLAYINNCSNPVGGKERH